MVEKQGILEENQGMARVPYLLAIESPLSLTNTVYSKLCCKRALPLFLVGSPDSQQRHFLVDNWYPTG